MTQVPHNIFDEIKKHDLGAFKVLGVDHGGVAQAIAFLLNNAMPEMAQHLRQMAQAGYVLQGPVDGFVAAGVSLPDGEFIVLSSLYTEYNTNAEIMTSIVQEIGFLKAFNRSQEENELRAQKALLWLPQQKPVAAPVSFISSAIKKIDHAIKRTPEENEKS